MAEETSGFFALISIYPSQPGPNLVTLFSACKILSQQTRFIERDMDWSVLQHLPKSQQTRGGMKPHLLL